MATELQITKARVAILSLVPVGYGMSRDEADSYAQAAIKAAAEWQPIETAPKGRLVLVGFFNSLGKWRSAHAQWRDDLPQHDDADEDDDPAPAGWYEGSLEAEMLFAISPSHWMPLPDPPEI